MPLRIAVTGTLSALLVAASTNLPRAREESAPEGLEDPIRAALAVPTLGEGPTQREAREFTPGRIPALDFRCIAAGLVARVGEMRERDLSHAQSPELSCSGQLEAVESRRRLSAWKDRWSSRPATASDKVEEER